MLVTIFLLVNISSENNIADTFFRCTPYTLFVSLLSIEISIVLLFSLIYSSSGTLSTFSLNCTYFFVPFKNSGVDCIIVANGQFNTPVSYNYKNNLNGKPETYLPENNTLAPSNIPQKTLEGLQDLGDSVVPISSINKLRELWKDNCNIELIRDKDHFTILKSYELGLIITSII